jgi:RNA polymerase sigma factor (sigma-70 family)
MQEHQDRTAIADVDVVLLACRGDIAAQNELIRLVWPHAYRMARAILQRREIAQDVAQDACVQMVRGLPVLRDARAFDAWFIRILWRTVARARRAHRDHDELVPESGQPVDPWLHDDLIDLRSALARLKADFRIAFLLHAVYGYNSVEIGRALGLPPPTVRFRLYRAKSILRSILADQKTTQHSFKKVIANV